MVQLSDVLSSHLIWCGDATDAADEGSTVRLRRGLQMPQLGLGSGDLEGREGREAIVLRSEQAQPFHLPHGRILFVTGNISDFVYLHSSEL